jgi:hypothetical protein
MAHLIAGALRSTDVNARPTIVYGNRRIAERMLDGTPAFTRDELTAILDGAKSLDEPPER